MNSQQFSYFMGIDVSKKTLDYTLVKGREMMMQGKVPNNGKGFSCLQGQVKGAQIAQEEVLFCCENTGIYSSVLAQACQQAGYTLWVENPLAIKRSMGLTRGKNDKIDSLRIALYASRFQDKCRPYELPRKEVQNLRTLVRLRAKFLKISGQITKTLHELNEVEDPATFKLAEGFCKKPLKANKAAIKEAEKAIQELVRKDEKLAHAMKITTSVEGVGPVTATMLIVCSNEFKAISEPEKMASNAGVAPFEHQSGTSVRGRNQVSPYANKPLKAVLHMAALAASHGTGELAEYYQRKLKEGKPPMVILNAISNKLIHRVYACVRDNRLYEKVYVKKLA